MATKEATGLFDTALDQFGPHSRIIAPTGVESSYSYDRGGDIDELRIYDRMLSDDNIAGLARNQIPQNIPAISRAVLQVRHATPTRPGAPVVPAQGRLDSGSGHAANWQQEWNLKYGWNRPGDTPVCSATNSRPFARSRSTTSTISIAGGGKRPTAFARPPGPVSSIARALSAATTTIELPDWDCYSLSGKVVTFDMPDEPWNHLEIAGGAWGNWSLLSHDKENANDCEKTLFERPKGQEITYHQLD